MRELKQQLINNPDSIISTLEHFDFTDVQERKGRIYFCFGYGHDNKTNNISLTDNPNVYVQDYVRPDLKGDIISYIMKSRNVPFKDVVSVIKKELGITGTSFTKRKVFGGIFNVAKRTASYESKVHSETILQSYKGLNTKFLKDNISLSTQEDFGLGFDIDSQRITIPIRNAYGELIGVKGRCNYTPKDDEPKYLYLVPCAMSTTLFGYSQNYQHLVNAEEIFIFEAEKSVMQAYDFGVKNTVALGSNNLSTTQIKLLYELQPKKIVFMLDKGLDYSQTYNNRDSLISFCKMNEFEIYMWDWKKSNLPDKSSPTDYGEDTFYECLLEIERI